MAGEFTYFIVFGWGGGVDFCSGKFLFCCKSSPQTVVGCH